MTQQTTAHGSPLTVHDPGPPLCDTCAWQWPRHDVTATFRCINPAACAVAGEKEAGSVFHIFAPVASERVLAHSITTAGGCLYHKPFPPDSGRAGNPGGRALAALALLCFGAGFLLHAFLTEVRP